MSYPSHNAWVEGLVEVIDWERRVYNEEKLHGDALREAKYDATKIAFDKVLHVFYKEYGIGLDEMTEILEKKKMRHAHGIKNAGQWR